MTNASNHEENNNVSNFKKPMVSLLVQLDQFCSMKAMINDIPVTSSTFYQGGPTSTYIPINHYLKPEDNTLLLNAWTKVKNFPSDYTSNCSVTLIIWDSETMTPDSKEAITLGKMTLSMVEADQIKQKQGKLILGKQPDNVVKRVLHGDIDARSLRGAEIDAVNPLEYKVIFKKGGEAWVAKRDFDPGFKVPPSKWQSSKIIKDNARTRKSVIKMYQSLWNYHKNHDLKGWRRITFEGDNEVATMSYNTIDQLLIGTALGGILQGKDKSWELQALDFETAQMRIVANGKLVTLLTDNVGAVIHYDSKVDENFRKGIPIYLRKEGKGWVISR